MWPRSDATLAAKWQPTGGEEELPLSPHYLIGDSEEMVETLLARRERWGISYITMPANALAVLAPVIARLLT